MTKSSLWTLLVVGVLLTISLLTTMLENLYERSPWWHFPPNPLNRISPPLSVPYRIVVCGLIRDAEGRIPWLRNTLNLWLESFREAKIVLVENDSVDGTRSLLSVWEQQDPRVVLLGAKHLPAAQRATRIRTSGRSRMKKMCFLRNLYLNWLHQSSCQEWELTLVMDLDIEFTGISKTHLADEARLLMGSADYSAIAVNSLSPSIAYDGGRMWTYYDTFAWQDYRQATKSWEHLLPLAFRWRRFGTLDAIRATPVRSAFGGMVLYKTDSLLAAGMYTTKLDQRAGGYQCEHISIHTRMNVVFDPLWKVKALH